MTMLVVNIFEAKAKLSEYPQIAAKGEGVPIRKTNRPIAELHAVQSTRTAPRPIGLRAEVHCAALFFEQLPEDTLGGFYVRQPRPAGRRGPLSSRPAERGGEGPAGFGKAPAAEAQPMKLLLDTCTFLWIVADAPGSRRAPATSFSAADNEVYLSAASAWEIAVKHGLGRLPLPESPDRFVRDMREAHGIAACR